MMKPSSWIDERLPEMIWAALVRASLSQDQALSEFRRFLNFIFEHPKKDLLSDITLTGIGTLEQDLREEVISRLIQTPRIGNALATLRLFQTLPARETWDKLLPGTEPDVRLLMAATGAHLWHQSQEATDCRWLRIMAKFLTGKLHVSPEMAREWVGYPHEGDQRAVRPGIRATEISFGCPDQTWSQNFWKEAWENTPCLELTVQPKEVSAHSTITISRIAEVANDLNQHWLVTHSTTAVDAKHDAVFGMAFYVLKLLEELLESGTSTAILGRLALRTILEIHISLRFLLGRDDEALWKKWRQFGSGQAKLNALRFDGAEPPKYINVESVERIAGEDIWEEFLNINIGSWSGLDLRRLSEQAGLKSTYDKYYSWTSGYVHGTWGPVRESCFQTCGNPLHRLHRYPENQILPDTLEDAVSLVDSILADLDASYPEFKQRLSSQTPTQTAQEI